MGDMQFNGTPEEWDALVKKNRQTTQTAVQWLHEIAKQREPDKFDWEQAKQMEKEQMHKCASFWRRKENDIEKPMFDIYYNETYKK